MKKLENKAHKDKYKGNNNHNNNNNNKKNN